MKRRRSSRKAVIAATVISLLMLAIVPGAVSAVTGASLTQTANTDCAAGVVEFQGEAWDLPASTQVLVELMITRVDGNLVNQGSQVPTSADGSVVQVFTLTDQAGAETGDAAVFTVYDLLGTTLATDSATLDCTAAPTGPTSKSQCQHGGWADWAIFRNTGECLKFVRNL